MLIMGTPRNYMSKSKPTTLIEKPLEMQRGSRIKLEKWF